MLPNLYLCRSWTVSDFFVFLLGRKSEVDSSSPWPSNSLLYQLSGLPREHSGKESACWCRRCKRRKFDPWVGKIPWRRKWKPPPVFLPGEFHGQRSLVGYSPWGRNRVRHDLATKQQLHFDKVEKQGLECVWGMQGRGRGRWGEKKHTVEKAKMNFKGSWLYLCTNSIFIEYLW